MTHSFPTLRSSDLPVSSGRRARDRRPAGNVVTQHHRMGYGAQPLSLLLRRLAFERERALMLLGERQFIPPSVLDMLDHQSVERGTGLAIEIVIGDRKSVV